MSNLNKSEKIIFPSKPIESKLTTGGYLLTDVMTYNMAKSGSLFAGCGLLVMAIILFFIGSFLGGFHNIFLAMTASFVNIPVIIKYAFFALLGLVIIQTIWVATTKVVYPAIESIQQNKKGSNLGAGELLFSRYPLRMGEEYDFKFSRKSDQLIELKEPGTIEGLLIGLEIVSYTVGTDTKTDEVFFWEEVLFRETIFPIGTSIFEYSGKLGIPLNFPPSFEGKNNQIRWVMAIKLNLPGVVIYKPSLYLPSLGLSNFTLIVDPEVVI